MVEQQNFRTAFNGFNREDVVHYIEQLNAKHAAEVSQLNSDLQYLQEKLAQYEDAVEETLMEAPAPELEDQIEEQAAALVEQSDRVEELEQQLTEAREAAQTAEALLEEAEAENARLQALLDTALARQNETRTQENTELSTYRRAERVEREARARANQICDQVNGALAEATTKVDDTAAQIAAIADQAMQQIKQLQLAVTGSKAVLQDTATALLAIRPTDEEE